MGGSLGLCRVIVLWFPECACHVYIICLLVSALPTQISPRVPWMGPLDAHLQNQPQSPHGVGGVNRPILHVAVVLWEWLLEL